MVRSAIVYHKCVHGQMKPKCDCAKMKLLSSVKHKMHWSNMCKIEWRKYIIFCLKVLSFKQRVFRILLSYYFNKFKNNTCLMSSYEKISILRKVGFKYFKNMRVSNYIVQDHVKRYLTNASWRDTRSNATKETFKSFYPLHAWVNHVLRVYFKL